MRRNIWFITELCIMLFTLLYIWSNSLQSIFQSNIQSKKVLEIIEGVFHTPPLDTENAQHIVRKAAHVLEFTLLGIEMILFLYLIGRLRRQYFMTILFIGLLSAVLDETIQLFSGRGSQVADIWIDFAGLMVGIGVGLIVYIIIGRVKIQVCKLRHSAIDKRQKYQYNNARGS
jgi:VanZ family protein